MSGPSVLLQALAKMLAVSVLHLGFLLLQALLWVTGEKVFGVFFNIARFHVFPVGGEEVSQDEEDEEINDQDDESDGDGNANDSSSSGNDKVGGANESTEPDEDENEADTDSDSEASYIENEENTEVLILQKVMSSSTSVVENGLAGLFTNITYISDDDLEDLQRFLTAPEDAELDCSKCPACKQKKGLLKQQPKLAQAAYRTLYQLHQLLQPLLAWAGLPSQDLYVVRRRWREGTVLSMVMQHTGTGQLVLVKEHLVVEVAEVESFLTKFEEFLTPGRELDSVLACTGLHCRLGRAARYALGEVVTEDINLLDLEVRVMKSRLGMVEEICSICLSVLEVGEEVAVLRCDHTFHGVCVGRWVGEGHYSCPVCRGEVKRREEGEVGY